MNKTSQDRLIGSRWWITAGAAVLLAGCGGGGGGGVDTAVATQDELVPEAVLTQEVAPAYHIAPLILDEPDGVDADTPDASAAALPHSQTVSTEMAGLDTWGLSVQALTEAPRQTASATNAKAMAVASPGTRTIVTYTPAQIRAAYGLPMLPPTGTTLTAEQAAQFGAGQTIYVIGAMHDPNIEKELSAFNLKFGLPGCMTKAVAVGATLPLPAAAPADGCVLSVVYSTAAGAMRSNAPKFDSSWTTEIALGVQWAHATAPLARIVLIEAQDAAFNNLLGAIKLANAMGPGIVSMSFGIAEGDWTASAESVFKGTGMTYLAGTGDAGAAVRWPAVSPNVLAVGGTRLTYSNGARTEVGWSGTGGGISRYTRTPVYQAGGLPSAVALARRGVADVAFNADPATGQYAAVIPSGSTTAKWVSAGGASIATPQWAGLLAVANAVRAQAGKAALGLPHASLYGLASTDAGYRSAFADISSGSNGSCAICTAKVGYDTLAGLGTPNAASLLQALVATNVAVVSPPVVLPGSISGTAGTALSFTVSVAAANPVTYRLAGAPVGMSIGANGAVSWTNPVAGTYAVTVTAADSKTGQSGQGTYAVTIGAAAVAPTVTAMTVSGKAGTALSVNVAVTGANPVTYSLAGAPAGMSVNTTGTISWTTPVAGTYAVTVTVKDSKTGLSGQGVYTVKIDAVTTTTTTTGSTGSGTTTTTGGTTSGTTTTTTSPGAAPVEMLALAACVASGKGSDYQVGPGKTYTTLDAVPWESLKAGDTVRIFYSSTPYKGKFLVAAKGTAAAPVRICGVRGPNNERPVIDGNGATTRKALNGLYGSNAVTNGSTVSDIHQGRSIIVLKPLATSASAWTDYPSYIQIDGLHITRAHPNYSFTDASGATKKYIDFGAAIWVDRGQHITIADNEISDSQMAIFTKSTDDGDFAVTKDIRIAGNTMWGHGITGDVHMHTTYTQSVGIVMEFNRYGALRSGADGNSIKDRSVGTVVRYNRIEDGAHAVDLVEAEDFPQTAMKDPAYRTTFVYGNLITKNGEYGSVIHYGGDHYGSAAGASWGEPIFRKGTLYFFNNTVATTGSEAWLFQLATTEEKAEVWNNVFVFAAGMTNRNLRMSTYLGSAWTPGGIINLGRNWASTGWQDSDQYHPVPGQLNGTANLISGTTSPLDSTTFVPLAGSAALDAGVAAPAAAAGYPVSYQISASAIPSARKVNGAGPDLGAVER